MIGYTPEIENPYPEQSGGEITDFEYVSPLVLYRFADANVALGDGADAEYIVERPYKVEFKLDGNDRVVEVPKSRLAHQSISYNPETSRTRSGRQGRGTATALPN